VYRAQGFADTHRSAEHLAEVLNISSSEVAVCSTGLIGEYLPMSKLLHGIAVTATKMSSEDLIGAATAIMTTDTHPKIASVEKFGVTVTGIAKGAGMLAPSLATMLSVVMTDAIVSEEGLQDLFGAVVNRTYNRIDSDGCTSTNDTVLLLASGSSGMQISMAELEELLMEVCSSLSSQLIADAEGHTKIVSIEVVGARSEADAVNVGRACARNNLLKCALFGGDPNWGRILAAVGTADAEFDPYNIDVELNGCHWLHDQVRPEMIDLAWIFQVLKFPSFVNLNAGTDSATIYTNDLSHDYVHENSAYAT